MAIDRIGKSGIPQGAGSASGVSKPFELGHAAAVEKTGAVEPLSPLAKLRAGEVDVNGYVDLKVNEATKGLEGLPFGDLADIKQLLHDQMVSDPQVVELVHRATGKMPEPSAED